MKDLKTLWVRISWPRNDVDGKDERKFLEDEALKCIVRVPPASVEGNRKVVIKEGKVQIEVSEEVWRVWRGYEERGKLEEREEGI